LFSLQSNQIRIPMNIEANVKAAQRNGTIERMISDFLLLFLLLKPQPISAIIKINKGPQIKRANGFRNANINAIKGDTNKNCRYPIEPGDRDPNGAVAQNPAMTDSR